MDCCTDHKTIKKAKSRLKKWIEYDKLKKFPCKDSWDGDGIIVDYPYYHRRKHNDGPITAWNFAGNDWYNLSNKKIDAKPTHKEISKLGYMDILNIDLVSVHKGTIMYGILFETKKMYV